MTVVKIRSRGLPWAAVVNSLTREPQGLVVKAETKQRLVVGAVVLFVLASLYLVTGWFGIRPYDEPPVVGERVEEVIERLGPPHFDSRRNDGDTDREYQLGYTDGLGTRHHLSVENGVIVEIEYSSK